MGACGSACQRRRYNELVHSQNLLKKQFETEIDKLKNESTKLQRKLEQQTAEINKYKTSEKERIIYNQKQKLQNLKLNDMQTELENKILKLNELIIEYKESKESKEKSDSQNLEIAKFKKEIEKLKKEKQNMQQLKAENSKLKNELRSRMDEKNVTDNGVKSMLRRASISNVIDVKTIVLNRYKTIDSLQTPNDNDAQDVSVYDDESSIASSEELEIEKAKLERDKQQKIDEEVTAMHQELAQMNLIVNACQTQDLEDSKLNDTERRDLDRSMKLSVVDVNRARSKLFRPSSAVKWNAAELIKQKKEMTTALTHLVETHVTATKEENNESPQ